LRWSFIAYKGKLDWCCL